MTKDWAARLPKSVRIAAYDFQIEVWKILAAASAQRWGECSTMEQVIRVQEEMPTLAKMVDTLLHEIHHAIYWAYGVQDEDKEERIVGFFGTAWTQVWRDNPVLLEWLSQACAEIRKPA